MRQMIKKTRRSQLLRDLANACDAKATKLQRKGDPKWREHFNRALSLRVEANKIEDEQDRTTNPEYYR